MISIDGELYHAYLDQINLTMIPVLLKAMCKFNKKKTIKIPVEFFGGP